MTSKFEMDVLEAREKLIQDACKNHNATPLEVERRCKKVLEEFDSDFENLKRSRGLGLLLTPNMPVLVEKMKNEFTGKNVYTSGELFTIRDIAKIPGPEFESILKEIFKSQGYKILKNPNSENSEADIILEKSNKKTLVQIKKWTGLVSKKAIQDVISKMTNCECNETWLVSNSRLKKPIQEFAKNNHVKIIGQEEILKLA